MIIHLIDGTYQLFRHFYGQRRFNKGQDKLFGAVIGVLHTVLEMIESGLEGLESIAADRHIRTFAARAGVDDDDYDFLKSTFCVAADLQLVPAGICGDESGLLLCFD
jgi:hypothetical protein